MLKLPMRGSSLKHADAKTNWSSVKINMDNSLHADTIYVDIHYIATEVYVLLYTKYLTLLLYVAIPLYPRCLKYNC